MRAVHKRYLREILPATAAYMLMLFVSVRLMEHAEQRGWRGVLAVLQVLPIIWMVRAMLRVIRDQDELERRIDLESIAIAATLTGVGFFTYGLLGDAQVVPSLNGGAVAIWVLPSLFGSFGLAKCLYVAPRFRRA